MRDRPRKKCPGSQAELIQESLRMLAWFRQEVAIGANEAERGKFSSLTLAEIKIQVLSDHIIVRDRIRKEVQQ
jgi:hypothetical protein